MHERSERPFVRDSSFDAFRHELRHLPLAALAIAVATAFLHRRNRTHAAISFERAALEENYFAGAFIRSGKKRPYHNGVCARRNRFSDVARILDAAVSNDRNTRTACGSRTVEYRSNLRHACPRYHASRAYGPRPHACFDRINTCENQIFRRFGCSDVASYEINLREAALDSFHRSDDAFRVAMRC